MTTALQVAANASNATLSTGPKTSAGKARSSKNALRHGLRSELPVLPGERVEDWEAHHDGVVRALAPAGALEAALAERVALCLWRLRRATAYETAVTTLGIEEVEEETRQQAERVDHRFVHLIGEEDPPLPMRLGGFLPADAHVEGRDTREALEHLLETAEEYGASSLPDPGDEGWLAELGVPKEELCDAYEWTGWTADMVRRAGAQIARAAKVRPDKLLARTVEDRGQVEADTRERVEDLERNVKDLRRRIRTREDRLRQRRMLPDDPTLNKVTRYEAHLSRQMLQALHTLERLQRARAGEPVPAPAALDVTVSNEEALALPSAEGNGLAG
jgi:hypothetical protein